MGLVVLTSFSVFIFVSCLECSADTMGQYSPTDKRVVAKRSQSPVVRKSFRIEESSHVPLLIYSLILTRWVLRIAGFISILVLTDVQKLRNHGRFVTMSESGNRALKVKGQSVSQCKQFATVATVKCSNSGRVCAPREAEVTADFELLWIDFSCHFIIQHTTEIAKIEPEYSRILKSLWICDYWKMFLEWSLTVISTSSQQDVQFPSIVCFGLCSANEFWEWTDRLHCTRMIQYVGIFYPRTCSWDGFEILQVTWIDM